jgi:ferritin-like metal-binding protein YciE
LHAAELEHARFPPELIKAAQDPDVQQILTDHLRETNSHAERLRGVLNKIDNGPDEKPPATLPASEADAQEILTLGLEGPARSQ